MDVSDLHYSVRLHSVFKTRSGGERLVNMMVRGAYHRENRILSVIGSVRLFVIHIVYTSVKLF